MAGKQEQEQEQEQHACAIEEVTPEVAKRMLHSGNVRNRTLNEATVRRYMGIIGRGEWMFDSTDAIGLAQGGGVVNGQHRLEAISRGNVPVQALVVRGVRPEVVRIVDQGMRRNLAQTLQIDGGYDSPTITANAVEWLYLMIHRMERRCPAEYKGTVPQFLEILTAHPNVVLSQDKAADVYTKIPKLRGVTRGALTAYHYAMACADAALADEFYGQLATGLDVVDESPVYVLREKFFEDSKKRTDLQMERWEALTYLVRAWEATRGGQALTSRQLKVDKRGPRAAQVPTISGVDWLAEAAEPEPAGETEE